MKGKIIDWITGYFVDCEFLINLTNMPRNIIALTLLVTANLALYKVSVKTTLVMVAITITIFLVLAYVFGRTKLREKIERKRGLKSGPWIDINRRLDEIEEKLK